MSVPLNERTSGKLEVCVKAHFLCCYTLQITANDKIFDEKYKESLTDKIINAAIDIHTLVWSANNVRVNSQEDYYKRHMMQEDAAIKCNTLLSLIEIAHKMFHLSSKRVQYWSGLAIETRKLIRAWHESDAKRYIEYR